MNEKPQCSCNIRGVGVGVVLGGTMFYDAVAWDENKVLCITQPVPQQPDGAIHKSFQWRHTTDVKQA